MSEPNARPGFRVNGVNINIHSMTEAVAAATQGATVGDGFCLFTLNLDHCAKLRRVRDFAAAYGRARFVSADGFPIVMLGRLNGVVIERTTGADLVWPLCAEAARSRLPIFLLGPSTNVLERTRARLRARLPDIEISDSYAPGPDFEAYSREADDAIERIRISGARLCLIGIGAPRQEILAARCLDVMPDVGFVCVGAAFDFLAGSQKRAPQFFQQHGLEWLWRLSSDPRRLAARYLQCAMLFPRLAAEAIPHAIAMRRRHP